MPRIIKQLHTWITEALNWLIDDTEEDRKDYTLEDWTDE